MMLFLAAIPTFAGIVLMARAFARGEWNDRLPSDPEPHWRLALGWVLVAGGTLVMAAMVILPWLTLSQTTPP